MTTIVSKDNTKEALKEHVVKLRLDQIKDADVVDDRAYIVHVAEYDRIIELITESLRVAREYDGTRSGTFRRTGRDHCQDDHNICHHEQQFKRNHDTIMLAGVRGSGKTTFMLSIIDHIKKGNMGIQLGEDSQAEFGIETLPIFDPTLIEDKTHIFANIISMIKAKVDKKAKKSNCFSDSNSEMFKQYQQWEKSFRELADGLPTIDGLGGNSFNSDLWMDTEYIMKKGVGLANAANNLEKTFHEFIRQSLRFLCKDAFFLCFDDVDTNFGKGWPVLEVLHKYLTTPQLITVLSGDPSLYSTLIRERQWLNFSDKLLRQECRNKAERQGFKETIAHLEEQYFLKLLKPQRRIFLNNLYQLNSFVPVNVIYQEKPDGEYLRPMYDRLLEYLGTGRSDKADSYRFLASLPLRSQKQLFLAFIRQEWPTAATRHFVQDIFDIYWSDLTVKSLNVSSLRNNPETISIHTLDYLIANNLLSEGYTLNQNFNDPLTNGAQFALSTILHDQAVNDPAQVFEYWVRVCMAREIGVLIGDRQVERGEGPSIRNFIDHCALTQQKSTRYLTRFTTAYLRAFRAYNYNRKSMIARRYDERSWHGTLPLYGLAEKTGGSIEERKSRIDYVLFHRDANTPPLLRIIGSIPLSGATDHSKRALPIYSIYNILGILGQVITTSRLYSANFNTSAREVATLLYRDAQFREYPLPNWASSYAIDEEDETTELPSNPDQFDPMVLMFAERLVLWSNMYECSTVTAAMLGKIFTRLFYTLNNLDTLNRDPLLGSWLNRMIVILLHSAVIVEAMEHHGDIAGSQLQLTNPVTKNDILIANLKRLNEEQQEEKPSLPFARWFLACPLWPLYLATDPEGLDLSDKIYQFVKTYVSKASKNPIFERWDKTESDFYPDVFSEYNLVQFLSEQEVCVKGYEKTEQFSSDSDADKIEFNFMHKKALIKAFIDQEISHKKAIQMSEEDLYKFVTSRKSSLTDRFTFKQNIGMEIKNRLGKSLTW